MSFHSPERQPDITSARAIVLRPGPVILLLKRTDTSRKDPGKWENPGGRVEVKVTGNNVREPETTEETCIREVAEEAGLAIRITEGYRHESVRPMTDSEGLFRLTTHIAHVIGGELRLGRGLSAYAWATIHGAFGYELTADSRAALGHLKPIMLTSHVCPAVPANQPWMIVTDMV